MTDIYFQLWWFFKSPWRRKFGFKQILANWLGSKFLINKDKIEHIELIIPCVNRLEQLKSAVLTSLKSIHNQEAITLIVVTHLDEEKALKKTISSHLPFVNSKVIGINMPFSRSVYLNAGLSSINENSYVFISDADIILPNQFISLFLRKVNAKKAWFPICNLLGKDGSVLEKYPEGTGLVGFKYDKELKYNESYKSWGNEDWDFLFKIVKTGKHVARSQNDGFLHLYHEPVDKSSYKKSW